ncbi:MAG TPA: GTPase Era [Elusimicrobia bacterium]|nr:GTPase Era [Elusimicrobiota bacterium]HCE97374.1 GTPase Era [Elusimicrobiota bacterium]
MTQPSANFKAGFVAIMGLPNAGKSTLLNALCGTRLSIVSPKPQTTRNNVIGILNEQDCQAVFMDTPGFLKPRNLFEKSMAGSIRKAALEDSDLAVLIIEPNLPPPDKLPFFDQLKNLRVPLYLVINKIDLYPGPAPAAATGDFFRKLLQVTEVFTVSALNLTGIKTLRKAITSALPESPPYYPTDQLSDRLERFFAAEIIRENIFKLYQDEIPYACAVEIEFFRETPGLPDHIYAIVHAERASQKPILIGQGGRSIRRLREDSQKAIEKFLGRPARLELIIKVTRDWQNSVNFLKKTGFYE